MSDPKPSMAQENFASAGPPTQFAPADFSSDEGALAYAEAQLDTLVAHAHVIQRDIQGRTHYCSLRSESLEEAEAWITQYRQFWQTRLDGLERFLEEKKQVNKE